MNIVDLTKEYESLYFDCLEDWSAEIKEAGPHKDCWYRKMKDNYLLPYPTPERAARSLARLVEYSSYLGIASGSA